MKVAQFWPLVLLKFSVILPKRAEAEEFSAPNWDDRSIKDRDESQTRDTVEFISVRQEPSRTSHVFKREPSAAVSQPVAPDNVWPPPPLVHRETNHL